MKNQEISALAEDAAENMPVLPKQNSKKFNTGLIKFVILAFILLLIYLLADKFINGKPVANSNGALNVIGFYYGPVNSKSPNEIIISLGKYNELKKGVIQTKLLDKADAKDEPKPAPPKLTKNQLLAKIPISTDYSKVVEIIGNPDKTLDITEQQKDSGFKMYLWNATPRIVCVFYKNKLISKL